MRFLITAGGTKEHIDPVRFITNASSGKMGSALALAAIEKGHQVTLISTAHDEINVPVHLVKVTSAADMFEAVKENFPDCDCLIMAAAVADFTCLNPSPLKIKKSAQTLTIQLVPTPDIVKWAAQNKRSQQIVVGFALEDAELMERAERKLKDKNLDMIAANEPAAISADISTVYIKTPDRNWRKIERKPKEYVAGKIIEMIEQIAGGPLG